MYISSAATVGRYWHGYKPLGVYEYFHDKLYDYYEVFRGGRGFCRRLEESMN